MFYTTHRNEEANISKKKSFFGLNYYEFNNMFRVNFYLTLVIAAEAHAL